MKVTAAQYGQALYEACQEVGDAGIDQVITNLLQVLEADDALDVYPEVIRAFEQLAATPERGGPSAQFGRSQHLSTAEAEALNTVAAARASVHEGVSEDLVGGVIIRVDDTVVDGSIAGALARMRNQLGED